MSDAMVLGAGYGEGESELARSGGHRRAAGKSRGAGTYREG